MSYMRRIYGGSPSLNFPIHSFWLHVVRCEAIVPSNCARSRLISSHSLGHSKPLRLVPPLQRAAAPRLLLLPRPVCAIHAHLHRDRVVLWPMRVARAVRTVRLAVCRRERVAVHGVRVCHGRGKQFHEPWKRACHGVREWDRWNRSRREAKRKERDERGYGKDGDQRGQGLGRGDGRADGVLEGGENEAGILRGDGRATMRWMLRRYDEYEKRSNVLKIWDGPVVGCCLFAMCV